jgi:hypothetical protein
LEVDTVANSLIITLDTQPPIIGISSKDTLNKNVPAIVIVQANKEVDVSSCTVYIIDDTGKKYSAQLDVQGNIITGTLDLSNLSVGKAVIFATVRDTNLNTSKTARRIVTITDEVMDRIEEMKVSVQTVNMAFEVEVIS